jgi:hypothetical protein
MLLELPFSDYLSIALAVCMRILPWIIEWFMWVVPYILIFTPFRWGRGLTFRWMPDHRAMIDEQDLVVSGYRRTLQGFEGVAIGILRLLRVGWGFENLL